jgi:hypothetical protein
MPNDASAKPAGRIRGSARLDIAKHRGKTGYGYWPDGVTAPRIGIRFALDYVRCGVDKRLGRQAGGAWDAGCRMPDAGCRMPDAGCRMPDAGSR